MALDQDLAGLAQGASQRDALQAHLVQAMRDSVTKAVAPSLTIQETGPSEVDAKLALVTALVPIYMSPQAGGGDEVGDAAILRKAFDAVWAQFKVDLVPVTQQTL